MFQELKNEQYNGYDISFFKYNGRDYVNVLIGKEGKAIEAFSSPSKEEGLEVAKDHINRRKNFTTTNQFTHKRKDFYDVDKHTQED